MDPDAEPPSMAMLTPPQPVTTLAELSGPWQAQTVEGVAVDLQTPGGWAGQPGWETFSGTICYRTQFQLSRWSNIKPLFLDLDSVGDIAEVIVNGQTAGVLGWAPYRVQIGHLSREGDNRLEVRVTNSILILP